MRRFLGLALLTLTCSTAAAATTPLTHVYLFGRISVGFSDDALFLGDGERVLELRRDGSRRTLATVEAPVTTIDATADGRFILVGDAGYVTDCYGDGVVPSGRLTMFAASGTRLWTRSGHTFDPRVVDGQIVVRYESHRRIVEETVDASTGRTLAKRRGALISCRLGSDARTSWLCDGY